MKHSSKAWFREQLRNYQAGEVIDLVDGSYKVSGGVIASQLKRGMKVMAVYNSTNEGFDFVEILGVYALHKWHEHDDEIKKHEHVFSSVKDALTSLDVTSFNDIIEKGFTLRLIIRDIEPRNEGGEESGCEEGDWYYLFNNRFCRGSGAEPLSFFVLKKA